MIYRPGSAARNRGFLLGTSGTIMGTLAQLYYERRWIFIAMKPRRGYLWVLFLVSALVALALFFIPAIIIQPFKHQTPFGLALAIALRDRAPWGTLVAGLVALAFAVVLWRSLDQDVQGSARPWWRTSTLWCKVALSSVMVLVVFSTVMSRLNYFEWMFHPVDSPRFETEAESKLDGSEMILAVRSGSDARAYPILQMAYHHVLNDVVNGVPIAVTY
jgi:hypothetical protein